MIIVYTQNDKQPAYCPEGVHCYVTDRLTVIIRLGVLPKDIPRFMIRVSDQNYKRILFCIGNRVNYQEGR